MLGQLAEGEVDAPVIERRCSRQYQNTGLYPAIDFYERALAFGSEEPPQKRFDRLLSAWRCTDWPGQTSCLFGRRFYRFRPRTAFQRLRCRQPASGKKRSGPCSSG